MGGVAVNDSLTVSDMAVGVGWAVAVVVRQQDIIDHRNSTRRGNEVKYFKNNIKRKTTELVRVILYLFDVYYYNAS